MEKHQAIGCAVVVLVGFSGAMLAAPGQARFGGAAPDANKVRITNTGRTEAVPVTIQEVMLPLDQKGPPLRVEVVGKPTVVVDPSTVVTVEVRRPQWEYKQVKIPNWEDASPTLSTEGALGWETTGVMFSAPGGTMLVLKRIK